MKEGLKHFEKKLLFNSVSKYLYIPLGLFSVLAIIPIILKDIVKIKLAENDSEDPNLRRNRAGRIIRLLANCLTIISFCGLALTSLASRFNIIPKPVAGWALMLAGGSEALIALRECIHEKNSKPSSREYMAMWGIAIVGGIYLIREGVKTLLSR